MELKELRKKATGLPLKPGVYQMKNAEGVIIYVGKAKKLRNRVSSYFFNPGNHGIKTEMMLSHVDNFDVIITSTEWEALVLENTLIKHYMPRYNILLKDDKGYPYIRADLEAPYVTFSIVSRPEQDGARYFGPYFGRTVAREVIDTVCETFRLPTCKRVFPRDIGKRRPCLEYQMGRCIGICAGFPYEQYRALLGEAVMLFEGHYEKLAADVKEKMEEAAQELDFEQAAKLRDRLRALKKLGDRQKVVAAKAPDTDVAAFWPGPVKSAAAVLHYAGGTLYSKDVSFFDAADKEEAPELLEDFIRGFYTDASSVPGEVICDPEPPDKAMLSKWLSNIAGKTIHVRGAGRDRRPYVKMALINARDEAERATTRAERISKTAQMLEKTLALESRPRRIEAYDISNTAGGETVGAMVVFVNGKPKKSEYRKFRIEGIEGQDDYACMAQVIERRFKKQLEGDEKFAKMPDLLLIDGGAGHVSSVLPVLKKLGITGVSVRGMVKDDRHRTRAAVDETGAEMSIRTNPAVFAFIGTIQEEVHRFAIKYHRSLRDKKDLHSELDAIPGVGQTRRAALLKKFKSVNGVKNATQAELETVVPKNVARAVIKYFEDGENK